MTSETSSLFEEVFSFEVFMSPAIPFQNFIQSLSILHDADLRFNGSRLVVEIEGTGLIMIENVAPNRLLFVQKFEHDGDFIETPTAILFTGTPQWIPIALQSDGDSICGAEISEDHLRLENCRDVAQGLIVDTCIKWAAALFSGRWIEDECVVACDRGDEPVAEELVAGLLADFGIVVEATR